LPCDVECRAKKGLKNAVKTAGDAIGKGLNIAGDALKGPNGVAIGLGSAGGLLVVLAACYCYCKRDKGVMKEGMEGGKSQKESLL
jgi:hypothetical protein